MSHDPYQVPTSNLEPDFELEKTGQQFYIVSSTKFTLLFFLTMGLYILFWFYKNWKQYKTSSGEKIWPVLRAIFAIFFTHSLFAKIRDSLDKQNIDYQWHPTVQATLYVVLSVTSWAAGQLSSLQMESSIIDLLALIIFPFLYLILLKAQKAINISQADPEGASNNKYTLANYLWSLFGILIWVSNIFLALGLLEQP